MSLELAAARWLKWEKRCRLVLTERTPRYCHGQPDVLGITESRYLLEIEVKRSMSDFRANQKKNHMQNRFCLESQISTPYMRSAPKQFWFMVPEKLVEKVQAELPDFAGLMTVRNGVSAEVVTPSPTNELSERLTIKECAKLMNCAGNQIVALMSEAAYRKASGTTGGDSTEMDEYFMEQQIRPAWWPMNVPFERTGYVNFQI